MTSLTRTVFDMTDSLTLIALGALVLSACAIFGCDRVLARFREDPDPRRVLRVRGAMIVSLIAVLVFYGSTVFLVVEPLVSWALPWLVRQGWSSADRLVIGVGVLAALAIAGWLRERIRSRGSTIPFGLGPGASALSVPNGGASLPHFAAMQYYALILNRTYKVFVAPSMLCGAKALGLVASPQEVSDDTLDEEYWTQTAMGAMYDKVDVTSPEFLRLNGANFQIAWSDIARIVFDPSPKWGMGNVPHSGRVFLHLRAGGRRELILLGKQDGEALKTVLETAAREATA